MIPRKILLSILLIWLTSTSALAFDQQHGQFDSLLKKYVSWNTTGVASQVDYSGFQRDKGELQNYIKRLSQVSKSEFNSWQKEARLAFLINAYNALTIDLILTGYPKIESIKDLGSFFSSPWSKSVINLFGEQRSLDDIEHKMIRKPGAYDDPRIHFAVVCASIGCPGLRAEVFTAEKLETQLEDSLRRFLSDQSRNRYNAQNGHLEVSKIFDWYGDDFAQGFRGKDSLISFLGDYADLLSVEQAGRDKIKKGQIDIDFLGYDWRLNKQP